jgi:hypothetical protein
MARANRLQVEQEHHKQAFETYYSLGPKRSYREAAQKLGISASAIKLMARSFHWHERIAERDAVITRKVSDQFTGSAVASRARYRKIVEASLGQVVKEIAAGKAAENIGNVDRLIRLLTHLDGGDKVVTVEMLNAMPPMEVSELIDAWMRLQSTETLRMIVDDAKTKKDYGLR